MGGVETRLLRPSHSDSVVFELPVPKMYAPGELYALTIAREDRAELTLPSFLANTGQHPCPHHLPIRGSHGRGRDGGYRLADDTISLRAADYSTTAVCQSPVRNAVHFVGAVPAAHPGQQQRHQMRFARAGGRSGRCLLRPFCWNTVVYNATFSTNRISTIISSSFSNFTAPASPTPTSAS